MGTQNMIHFLKQEYAARTVRNPGYSKRAFAMFLQVDHSLLAKFFRGERKISKNMSFKVGEKLGLSAEDVSEILAKTEDTANFAAVAESAQNSICA